MANEGFNLGTAYGSVVIDTTGISAAMRDAGRAMQNGFADIGRSVQGFGDSLLLAGNGLTQLTRPLVGLGQSALSAASEFDTLINQISIFGDVSGEDLEAVRQLALQMGADTKFSASDAAAALLELLKSGQSLEESTATLATTLDLAAAGGINLQSAAGIVTSALAIFGLNASEAARVSDALAQAANASRADINDLGQALTNVGPIAQTYGLSVEDTAAILGVFANNGIMGAEAGTQLKSMLLNLSRPTDDVAGAMRSLGVSLYDSNGNIKDFNTFILELDTALDQLPVQEQNEYMQILAGSYGIVGLSALRASGGIGDMQTAMGESATAAEVAKAQNESFAGVVESLKGSIETLMIEAMTPFMNNVLKPLVNQIIAVVNQITAWASENPELATTVITIVTAIAGLAAVLVPVGIAISTVATIVGVLGGALAFLVSPIGLAIAAATALGVAYATNFGGIRDFIDTQVRPIIERFIQVLQNIWNVVQPGLQALYDWFVAPGGGFDMIKQGAEMFYNIYLYPFIIQPLQTLWNLVSTGVTTFANWFNAPDGGLAQISISITTIKTFLTDNIITPLSNLWTSVSAGVEAFKNGLKSGFDWINANVITPIKTAIDGVIRVINDMVTKFNDAKNTITGGIGAYSDVGTNAGTVANAVTSGQVGIGDVLGALGNAISAEFSPRAIGGSMTAGMPYLVGERGPELFTPSTSGNISTAGNTQKAMGGTNFSFPGMVIYANSYAEGQAAADGFMHQVEQKIAFAGVTPS